MRFLFVGERRSPTAVRMGVTWRDGRLAAKPLHEALAAAAIDPLQQGWLNAWQDDGEPNLELRQQLLAQREVTIVALGLKASGVLRELGIQHKVLVHPAARGSIRKHERYVAHVHEVLLA